MNIGISQLIASDMSMEAFFSASKEAGYESVELSMKAAGPLTGSTTGEDIAAIARLSEEVGLPVESMTINHCTGNLLADGQAQNTSIEETVHGLEVAAKLGAPVALHTLGRFDTDLYYDDAYRNAVQ